MISRKKSNVYNQRKVSQLSSFSKQNITQSYNDFQEHHEWIDEAKTECKAESGC